MKIKFYPLKRNGEVAKTPVYFDSLNKETCAYYILNCGYEDYRYGYGNTSLYQIYCKILNDSSVDLEDQMFIDGRAISTERIKAEITKCVDEYRLIILAKKQELMREMQSLEAKHKSNCSDLNYCVFEFPKVSGRYEYLTKCLQALENGEISYLENESEYNDNFHNYVNVMDDVKPIVSEKLI